MAKRCLSRNVLKRAPAWEATAISVDPNAPISRGLAAQTTRATAHFRLLPLRLRLRARDTLRLPPYKGSTLRGAFGAVFRRIACSMPHLRECADCMLRTTCCYPYVFETAPPPDSTALSRYESVPRPFVIEPPLEDRLIYQPGDRLDFGLTLFGCGIDYLPYFVLTFKELGAAGIGAGRGRFELEEIVVADDASPDAVSGTVPHAVYSAGDGLVRPPSRTLTGAALEEAAAAGSARAVDAVTLRLLTPTRLKYEGRLTDRPEFHVIVRNLLRRLSSLSIFHHGRPLEVDYQGLIAHARQVRLERASTRWHDWERYSSRQHARMNLGGLVGDLTYTGDLAPFWPLLALGAHTHLGKNATFGLGWYQLLRPE